MIKIEEVEISGWKAAIRGMRNPKNSWNLSDTNFHEFTSLDNQGNEVECLASVPDIGENDLKLMKTLSKAGTDHGKFMRMIDVSFDLTAPLYWWKEFDTYKIGTVADSCSTMHKIHSRALELDDFSHEHLHGLWLRNLKVTICLINDAVLEYNALQDPDEKKDAWWQIIQLLPTSFNQKRTIQLNYEVLKNMYKSRKDHKLDEWHEFCAWIESLPYSELITGKETN